ncbi:hypothetical protein CMK11_07660 [Candidatus Poribacteria bacterium]|nr:hypothetical protein [Candidatus Poribacteria bacterium]
MNSTLPRVAAAIGVAACLATSAAAFDTPSIYTQSNILAAGNYNDGTASSDITLIIQLEAGGKIIFGEGADVMYHVPTEDVDGWTLPEFDDSDWEEGITSVGYADGDDNTEIVGGAVNSVYTRYNFGIPGARDIKSIILRIDYDDTYILWLNGTEIARGAAIATLTETPEIPAWDISKVQDSMPDVEATKVPAGTPNADRWDKPVTPFEQDVHETIHEIEIDVDFGGDSVLAVEPGGKLTTTWGKMKVR